MEAYTGFAEVYDIFMDGTPYEEWAEYLTLLLRTWGVSDVGKEAAADRKEDGSGTDGRRKRPDRENVSAGETRMGQENLTEWNPLKKRDTEARKEQERRKVLAEERNVVVDLGCGTGKLTELLSDAGYDMIGIDSSGEMLAVAMAAKEASGRDILYLNQDMRELALYGTVGAVVSVCDSLNYLLEEEELLAVFRLVNNYLYPGGVFLFDFNTVYKYETVLGDTTIAENREDCSFIWENYYDETSGINEYDLTLFVRERMENVTDGKDGPETAEKTRGLFRRFSETHFQRGYTLKTMRSLIEQAGMEFVTAVDADTHGGVRGESERIYIVAREKGKERADE